MITLNAIIQLVNDNQLFSSIEIQDNNVILHLNEKYNTLEYHKAINNWLCQIYKRCPDFQEKFEQTYFGNFKPYLTLKEGHGYKDGGDIQQSLIDFSTSTLPLRNDQVISDIKILNKSIIELFFPEKYITKERYLTINRNLFHLHESSSEFSKFFHRPNINEFTAILTLKREYQGKSKNELIILLNRIFSEKSSGFSTIHLPSHTETSNSLQSSIISDSSSNVISSFTCNKNYVTLTLCLKFNNKIFYRSINNLLREKYKGSAAFGLDFITPRKGVRKPFLELKKNHNLQRALVTLDNIINSIKADNIKIDDEIDSTSFQPISETLDSLAQESSPLNQNAQDNVSLNPWPLSLSGSNTFVDNLSTTQHSTPYLTTYNEEELAEAVEPTTEETAAVSIFSSSSQTEFAADDAQENTHSQTTLQFSGFSGATSVEDLAPQQETSEFNLYLPPELFTTEQEKIMWSPGFTEDTLSEEYHSPQEETWQNIPFLAEPLTHQPSEYTETENVLPSSVEWLPIDEEQEEELNAQEDTYSQTTLQFEATSVENLAPQQEASEYNIAYLLPELFTTEQEKTKLSSEFTSDTFSEEYYPPQEETWQSIPFLAEPLAHQPSEYTEIDKSPLAELLSIDEAHEQTQNQQTDGTQYAFAPTRIEENRQEQTLFNQAPLNDAPNQHQTIPIATQMILNDLIQGKLIHSVNASLDNRLRLRLTNEYNKFEYYETINQIFNLIYQTSPAFQKMFERPNLGNFCPYLTLKMPRTYKKDKAILEDLIQAARHSSFATVAQNFASTQQAGYPQFSINSQNEFQPVDQGILTAFRRSSKRTLDQIEEQHPYQTPTTPPLDEQRNQNRTKNPRGR
ncbi:MAG: hypothetical protein BGO43_08270 [Gammaproteobacteria bacterium 39-13]|nr:hypothetical protein [Gammaproteobacteria bacterium]OJV91666.1 MAG: hypothetical protein BGO43_08270 [Gammaproteobacteria bacterium 39-13]